MERPRQGAPEYRGFGPIRRKREKMHQHGHKRLASIQADQQNDHHPSETTHKNDQHDQQHDQQHCQNGQNCQNRRNDQENDHTPAGATITQCAVAGGACRRGSPGAAAPGGGGGAPGPCAGTKAGAERQTVERQCSRGNIEEAVLKRQYRRGNIKDSIEEAVSKRQY